MSWLRKLTRRGQKQPPAFKVTLKPGVAPPLYLESIKEEPAAEGTTCGWPTREALKAAKKQSGPIDFKPLPKCGKPAVVTVTNTYQNGKPTTESYCNRCRPRRSPETAAAFGLQNEDFSCTRCGQRVTDGVEECPLGEPIDDYGHTDVHERPESSSPPALLQ